MSKINKRFYLCAGTVAAAMLFGACASDAGAAEYVPTIAAEPTPAPEQPEPEVAEEIEIEQVEEPVELAVTGETYTITILPDNDYLVPMNMDWDWAPSHAGYHNGTVIWSHLGSNPETFRDTLEFYVEGSAEVERVLILPQEALVQVFVSFTDSGSGNHLWMLDMEEMLRASHPRGTFTVGSRWEEADWDDLSAIRMWLSEVQIIDADSQQVVWEGDPQLYFIGN